MITIHHQPYGSHVTRECYGVTGEHYGTERLSSLDAYYAMGYFPAQYPLPAIIQTIKQGRV